MGKGIFAYGGTHLEAADVEFKVKGDHIPDGIALRIEAAGYPSGFYHSLIMSNEQALDLYRVLREWALNLHADEAEAREAARAGEWVHGDDEEVD